MRGCRVMLFTRALVDLEYRLKEMSEKQPEVIQVLSLSTPQVYMTEEENAVLLSKVINDELSALQKQYPQKFMSFASLPMPHVNSSIEEIDRALLDLKMNGLVIGTSILGNFLDQKDLDPVFRRADELNACIFLHPQPNLGLDHLHEYNLLPICGFIFDTTCCVARLIFSGFFEKFPNIKVIVPHLVGAIPYLMGRLDIGHEAYPEARAIISKPPSEYVKRMYMDLVSYSPEAIRFVAGLLGTDHLLYASDYPFVIGRPDKIMASMDAAGFSEAEQRQINYENAMRILNNV